MKRKKYNNDYERKYDQRAGFIAFIVFNVALWLFRFLLITGVRIYVHSFLQVNVFEYTLPFADQLETFIIMFPWVMNGLVIVLALIFRPQFTIGYLAGVALAFLAQFVFGVLFVAGCFAGIGVGYALIPEEDSAFNIGILCGRIAILAAIVFFGRLALRWYRSWWHNAAPPQNEPKE